MKPLTITLGLVLVMTAATWLGTRLPSEAADDAGAWEYKHVLIPLERRPRHYERADAELLKPLQALGRQGWELVSAYEPAGGFTVERRAQVEFWLKRRVR